MARLHAGSFDPAWSVTDMQAHLLRDICIGAGELLAGFTIIQHAVDQSEILTIAVDAAQRGQGIASMILRAGEQTAKKQGSEIMFLEVAEDNQAAIRLYEKASYKQFGRRPGYYRRKNGRVAALTFCKALDDSTP